MKELLNIATCHAWGEDELGAIFDHRKQKAKHDKEPDRGFSGQPNKRNKKDNWWHDEVPITIVG
jgi:hypothetical protein